MTPETGFGAYLVPRAGHPSETRAKWPLLSLPERVMNWRRLRSSMGSLRNPLCQALKHLKCLQLEQHST
jgi:hypothetical protein